MLVRLSVRNFKNKKSKAARLVKKRHQSENEQDLQEAAIQLLNHHQNLGDLLLEVSPPPPKVLCSKEGNNCGKLEVQTLPANGDSILVSALQRQASKLGVPVSVLSARTIVERIWELSMDKMACLILSSKNLLSHNAFSRLLFCKEIWKAEDKMACLILSSKNLLSHNAFSRLLFCKEIWKAEKPPVLEVVWHLHKESIVSLEELLERTHGFDVSVYRGAISVGTLKQFFIHTLTQILTYEPQLKVSDAIGMQSEWSFAKTCPLLTSLYRKLFVLFTAEELMAHLQQVLETHEVNWQNVLSCVSTLLVCQVQAQQKLKDLLTHLLTSAFEVYELESMITAFLLARQASLEGPAVFISYSEWFKISFGNASSYHGNSKKSLVFLLKFLSDLVPFEPPQYLKVHVLHPPYVPTKYRPLLLEYVSLAKTRLADLKVSIEEMGLYEDLSAVEAAAQPQCQAEQDVEKAIVLFVNMRRIPASVMEARADKIPASLYSTYIQACQKEKQRQLEDVSAQIALVSEVLKSIINDSSGDLFKEPSIKLNVVAPKLEPLETEGPSLSGVHILGLSAFVIDLHESERMVPLVDTGVHLVSFTECVTQLLTCSTEESMTFCLRFCIAAVSYGLCKLETGSVEEMQAYVPHGIFKKLTFKDWVMAELDVQPGRDALSESERSKTVNSMQPLGSVLCWYSNTCYTDIICRLQEMVFDLELMQARAVAAGALHEDGHFLFRLIRERFSKIQINQSLSSQLVQQQELHAITRIITSLPPSVLLRTNLEKKKISLKCEDFFHFVNAEQFWWPKLEPVLWSQWSRLIEEPVPAELQKMSDCQIWARSALCGKAGSPPSDSPFVLAAFLYFSFLRQSSNINIGAVLGGIDEDCEQVDSAELMGAQQFLLQVISQCPQESFAYRKQLEDACADLDPEVKAALTFRLNPIDNDSLYEEPDFL
ncbi:Fanconi anemia group A protein [Acipenser ruthenus]|uniref:Fanconi anemia group A protein n=1 Tax=Acipenser ruthenus TaxID=7906 RepID=A0A444U7R4_ACIRT|nr:Fanconi anemia group A protein [Acipenser ruthenus]